MIDLKYLRENPDVIRNDLEKRRDFEKKTWVDEILHDDEEYRTLLNDSQALRQKRNEVSKKVSEGKKKGENVDALMQEAKEIPKKLNEIETKVEKLLSNIKSKLMRLPNILDESVPIGETEEENVEVEQINPKPEFDFEPISHAELVEKLDLADLERAAKITGARFYFLKGDLALLDLALQRYAVDFMTKKDFELIIPPHMMNRKAYEGVTDLDDFENVMYNVQPDNFYMIATSEHPLTAMYMNEILEEKQLPIKMVGLSHCFRREVGAHQGDKGIWRVHQFTKVEQIVLCKPEESEKFHDDLLNNAKDFFTSLKLHFRVVSICTADMGTVAAKKFDLEAWIPSLKTYKEVVSCSNCTAYQATRLGIRYRSSDGNKTLHTLNSTCVATSRALAAIIEQYQNKNGTIDIPEVLQPYMNGKKTIGLN
ncbi:serine--tRNA ligase [Candidatus Woesearchaeota archaeon]|jgi:seryl-tRNA synthetase|nr:serine--tRNA ligase [Candidatus Woesearchaeota archaeon]MBT4368061.1 serine--tRNA ligase [Candidatus Woesearchaeota archaeon]MBT4712549.1 serine--tRNA ligase [Candidatus Woesearchaeota archaeon]MBT6639462.1 serine--tRNA ligase [Candidatus Woesearchaeota archaeon]MBT7133634.1 serine--tRNA ligase [Candidatus Woesearchaeota archaeon]